MIKSLVVFLTLLTADYQINPDQIQGKLEVEVDADNCIERLCLTTTKRKCYETPTKGRTITVISGVLLVRINSFDRCRNGQFFLWYNRKFTSSDYSQSIVYLDNKDGDWMAYDSWGRPFRRLNFKARLKLGVPIGIDKVEFY